MEDSIRVVIAVLSRRGQYERRQVIRETWGNLTSYQTYPGWDAGFGIQKHVKLYFFIGLGEEEPEDVQEPDVITIPVQESYRRMNVKVFGMMERVADMHQELIYLMRVDDDVYLRLEPILWKIMRNAPLRYWWGNIDYGSAPNRNETHMHYNSHIQFPPLIDPMFGDLFPPYARGSLWVMSIDLLDLVVAQAHAIFKDIYAQYGGDIDLSEYVPHPDDPMIGWLVLQLIERNDFVNLDDRDFNSFSLNPSCSSQFSMIHGRTYMVHHVTPNITRCMWNLDIAHKDTRRLTPATGNLTDLCPCAVHVEEERDPIHKGNEFWYPMRRFSDVQTDIEEKVMDHKESVQDAEDEKHFEASSLECLELGIDYAGHDVKAFADAKNPLMCQELCIKHEQYGVLSEKQELEKLECTYFTWMESGACYLKNSDEGRREARGAVSGPVRCGRISISSSGIGSSTSISSSNNII